MPAAFTPGVGPSISPTGGTRCTCSRCGPRAAGRWRCTAFRRRSAAGGAGNPLSLWIAGDGPERAALQRQASRLGITPHVQFLGELSHDRIPAFLWGLDLFVNPSRAESFGVAALEAAASGLPVVAS